MQSNKEKDSTEQVRWNDILIENRIQGAKVQRVHDDERDTGAHHQPTQCPQLTTPLCVLWMSCLIVGSFLSKLDLDPANPAFVPGQPQLHIVRGGGSRREHSRTE
jgi:hypothetical protein